MNLIYAGFRLVRGGNLLIMLLTICSTYLFMADSEMSGLLNPGFLFLSCGCLLIMAGGYVINDLVDIEADLKNKPEKVVIGNEIGKKTGFTLYALLTLSGIAFGFIINSSVLLVFIGSALVLLIYSLFLQKTQWAGNIAVSLLIAITVWVVYFYQPSPGSVYLFAFYSLFAFLTNWLREIVKDLQDRGGDFLAGYKTLAVVRGVSFSIRISRILLIVLLLLSFFFAGYLYHIAQFVLSIYFISVIPALFIILFILLGNAAEGESPEKISRFVKLIMVAGLASLALLKLP